ncbi:DUF6163 family protein [Methylobacterium persicinum]|uniref:Uncharacterized protein n=1 Tax=Methylobacterium persicinum TaxID=374426 RepID=A0ABU0HJP0_9HYPH|nr:DUF6163 family protein [Methylobacterium persicinum]MDQ0442048.1 hypothetical protein [Methylobacterium persicinum]GJE38853.1 hypothetical protein KHHGKMAE_2929 [Methylobacterium persicinum]
MRGLIPLRSKPARPGSLLGDRIERDASPPPSTWDTALIWFMRLTALAWLAKAIFAWATILDVRPGAQPFEAEPFGRQAAIVYFAVVDAVAASGLWLTSAWGGVLWLLAVTSGLTLAILTPQLVPISTPLLIFGVLVVLIYFLLSWLAAKENR